MTNQPKMARNSYRTATCSALLGVYLFKDGPHVEPDAKAGAPLQLNVGDREWIACPNGIPDVFKALASMGDEWNGRRLAELPEDFGVIANEKGEVLYRAHSFDSFWAVRYLGHWDGELATGPITIQEIGIGPRVKAAKVNK